jgi:hypothetical protein
LGVLKERKVTLPELALIGGTRVALGIGLGLLLSRKLNRDECKAAGLALFLFGAVSTIPLVFEVLGKKD